MRSLKKGYDDIEAGRVHDASEALCEKKNKEQKTSLSSDDINDVIRQTQATLALQDLSLGSGGIAAIRSLVSGEISREEFQRSLKEQYQVNE